MAALMIEKIINHIDQSKPIVVVGTGPSSKKLQISPEVANIVCVNHAILRQPLASLCVTMYLHVDHIAEFCRKKIKRKIEIFEITQVDIFSNRMDCGDTMNMIVEYLQRHTECPYIALLGVEMSIKRDWRHQIESLSASHVRGEYRNPKIFRMMGNHFLENIPFVSQEQFFELTNV